MSKQDNINFIEWDAKHRQYLIRLAGDVESQEVRLNKMKASEVMYEALEAFDEYLTAPYPRNMELKRIAVEKMEQAKAKADKGVT